MKSTRIKTDENGYIVGILPSSKQPDFKTIFPANINRPDELRDEYGNPQYKISVTEEEITVSDITGENIKTTVKKCAIIHVPQTPTAEQTEAVRKRRIVRGIHKKYTIDDEIAELRKAIVALSQGKGLPVDFDTQTTAIETIKAIIK